MTLLYSLCVSPLSLIRTFVIGFKALPDNTGGYGLQILNVITSAKTLFPSEVPFSGSGTWIYFFAAHRAAHYTILCARFSLNKEFFCSNNLPRAGCMQGIGHSQACPWRCPVLTALTFLQWGWTDKNDEHACVGWRHVLRRQSQLGRGRDEVGHDGTRCWWEVLFRQVLRHPSPHKAPAATPQQMSLGSSRFGGNRVSAGSGPATQPNWLFLGEFQGQSHYRTRGPTVVGAMEGSTAGVPPKRQSGEQLTSQGTVLFVRH